MPTMLLGRVSQNEARMRRAGLAVALVTAGALVMPGSGALAAPAKCLELSASKTRAGSAEVALTAAVSSSTATSLVGAPVPRGRVRARTDDIEIGLRVDRVIVSDVRTDPDINVGSVTRTLVEALERELALVGLQLEQVYDSAFLDTATGRPLVSIPCP